VLAAMIIEWQIAFATLAEIETWLTCLPAQGAV
jgi:hypothetical protein